MSSECYNYSLRWFIHNQPSWICGSRLEKLLFEQAIGRCYINLLICATLESEGDVKCIQAYKPLLEVFLGNRREMFYGRVWTFMQNNTIPTEQCKFLVLDSVSDSAKDELETFLCRFRGRFS